jgi:protein-S-isoprenylcysteine O-methyltransferase Ste14
MRRPLAAFGTATFFLLAPGLVAGLIPWWLTGWRVIDGYPAWTPRRLVGLVLIASALPVLVGAFARFAVEGRGTPAPVVPTERLVVGGLYRYVRNPMYIAVVAIILGQALALGQVVLLAYAAIIAAAMASFARWYEEPTLRRRYGERYERYRLAVPGWWPRRRPWGG